MADDTEAPTVAETECTRCANALARETAARKALAILLPTQEQIMAPLGDGAIFVITAGRVLTRDDWATIAAFAALAARGSVAGAVLASQEASDG